jgi:hypothetical protein
MELLFLQCFLSSETGGILYKILVMSADNRAEVASYWPAVCLVDKSCIFLALKQIYILLTCNCMFLYNMLVHHLT